MSLDDKYIGISDDRSAHSLAVARKCYEISKERGHNEEFSRKMFLLGLIHDAGYEFSENQAKHPDISAEMLLSVFDGKIPEWTDEIIAIKNHGKMSLNTMEEWEILSTADMLTNPRREYIDASERLEDIVKRYGKDSKQFTDAFDVSCRLNLIGPNWASETIL